MLRTSLTVGLIAALGCLGSAAFANKNQTGRGRPATMTIDKHRVTPLRGGGFEVDGSFRVMAPGKLVLKRNGSPGSIFPRLGGVVDRKRVRPLGRGETEIGFRSLGPGTLLGKLEGMLARQQASKQQRAGKASPTRVRPGRGDATERMVIGAEGGPSVKVKITVQTSADSILGGQYAAAVKKNPFLRKTFDGFANEPVR